MKLFLRRILSMLSRMLSHTGLAKSKFLVGIQARATKWLHDSDVAEMGPYQFRFDTRDEVIAKKLILYNEFEKLEIDLLCKMVELGDVVLDVGANIGIHTVYLSNAVGPNGRVISVEPDPDNLRLLEENVNRNACGNVTILGCAFGDRTSEMELYQNNTNRGNLSLVGDLGNSGESRTIQVRRGDDALVELGLTPRLAKIDVEGYEKQVLQGLGHLKPEVVMMEFSLTYVERAGIDPIHFIESMCDEGYNVSLLDPDIGALRSINAAELVTYSRALCGESTILLEKVTSGPATETSV